MPPGAETDGEWGDTPSPLGEGSGEGAVRKIFVFFVENAIF